jgi:hypothetical protein
LDLGHAIAVVRSDLASSIRRSLVGADGTQCTLYEYASRHPGARQLRGRSGAAAYAVPLPQSTMRVVVRHNRHGGLLASLTTDLFLTPTRAPYELGVSLALRRWGVQTAEIVAYAVYPRRGLLQRSDVCSSEIPASRDLVDILRTNDERQRASAFVATARLVAALSRAGARHHDLNAKNVLLMGETAYVLDVDRVTLEGQPAAALVGNLKRLVRSLRKWRDEFGVQISDEEIGELESASRRAFQ